MCWLSEDALNHSGFVVSWTTDTNDVWNTKVEFIADDGASWSSDSLSACGCFFQVLELKALQLPAFDEWHPIRVLEESAADLLSDRSNERGVRQPGGLPYLPLPLFIDK